MSLCKPETWIAIHDLHYPLYDKGTFNVALDFIKRNKIAGFIFGGDQQDNLEISHHTKGKPIFRERAAYKKNTDGFDAEILQPLEKVLGKSKKIWINGNHERFEQDLIEEQPELEGTVDRVQLLKLAERGWEIIPLGHAYKLGKLKVIHGEILSGIGNQAGVFPSRKAVDLYAGNVLAGHTHAPQSYSRISPVEASDKWMGWVAPCCCNTNPSYLRNRPTAWLTGFTLVELFGTNFNLYPIITINGQFVYGGQLYGAK